MGGAGTVSAEVDGIPVCVERAALDDIEVMELLGELSDGNPFAVTKLMVAIFGREQYDNIKRSLADESGRTSATAVIEFFGKAFPALGEAAKNS